MRGEVTSFLFVVVVFSVCSVILLSDFFFFSFFMNPSTTKWNPSIHWSIHPLKGSWYLLSLWDWVSCHHRWCLPTNKMTLKLPMTLNLRTVAMFWWPEKPAPAARHHRYGSSWNVGSFQRRHLLQSTILCSTLLVSASVLLNVAYMTILCSTLLVSVSVLLKVANDNTL